MKANIVIKKSCAFFLAISLTASIALTGCSSTPQAPAARQMDPKSVKVIPAVISPLVVTVEYSSKLKAIQEVGISPEVGGKIAATLVDVGASVEKDQVLFTLDTTDLQTQLKQQQANRDYYRASLAKTRDSSLEQQMLTAEQTLSKAQLTYDDAKTNYEKNEALYQSGYVSKQSLSELETKLRNAQLDLNTARDNYNFLKEKAGPQSIEVASAQLQQAEAGLESTHTKLENSSVKSPIAGTVSLRNISAGELVTSSTKAFTVIDTRSLIAEVLLPDKIVEKIRKGQTIPLKISAQGEKSVNGVVDTISPSTDSTTQLYTVRIKVDNADNSIKPGMFARALLPAEQKDQVLTVPNEAIKIDSGVKYVYIVDNGQVRKKAVTIGLSNEKITEITSNLKENDPVIIEGQIFLNDGERVKIVDGNTGTSSGSPNANQNAATGRNGNNSGAPASGR